MFANQCQYLIWSSLPLLIYSQIKTEEYQPEITTEQISHNTEYDSIFPSYDNPNKYADCNNSKTCGEITTANFSRFPNRLCTCDEKCSIYDQCCSDAKYRNDNRSEFVCVETFFDGNIYVKNVCENTNDRMSNLCADRDGKEPIFSTIPVTSKDTNTTYQNLFCALCNGEKKFRFWNVVVLPKNQTNSAINSSILRDDLFGENFRKNYTIWAKIPQNFIYEIRHCVPDGLKNCLKENHLEIKQNCSNISIDNSTPTAINFQKCFANNLVAGNITTIKARNIPFDHCEKIPTDNSAHRMLCRKNDEQRSLNTSDTELTYIDNCFYQTVDGDLCLINSFFGSDQFKILGEEIYLYEFNSKFPSSEWTFSSEGNSSVYVCGTEIPRTEAERWFTYLNTLLSSTLITISIIFLVTYIVLYNNVQKMRYPFSRVIVCYSLTLLATFAVLLINDWLRSCEVTSAVLHYLLLSCFTWLMVASFECWRTVTSPTRMRNNKEHTWTRFGIYCAVGWVLPLLIVSVAVYFELSPIQSIPCTLKPGYGRLKQCFIAQQLPSLYFFHYPSTIMFLVNIYFFTHISVYVFCNSSVHRNFSIFAKLALVTGIPWTLGTLVMFTNSMVLRLIYNIFNSSQGIFIFLVFGYDKELFTDKFNKLYCHFFKKAQPQGNNDVAFQANNDIHTSRTSVNEYF